MRSASEREMRNRRVWRAGGEEHGYEPGRQVGCKL